MKVYIVYEWIAYEGSDIVSVHATREGAQAVVDANDNTHLSHGLSIQVYEVLP